MTNENERKIKVGIVVYLIFFTLAVRTWFNTFVSKKSCKNIQQDVEFDYLLFTQQWPPSSCVQWEEENRSNDCVSDIYFDHWTVHGIWPTKNGTIGPQYCNGTMKFKPAEIQALLPLLDRDWPNIRENFTENSLWQHEWDKHGTCLLTQPVLSGEYDYFSAGLGMAVKYNTTTVLAAAGITPSLSVSYNASAIWTAINDHFHVVPKMDCGYDKDLGQHILWQLKLCMSKNLELINCPLVHETDHLGSCPLTKPIFYPSKDLIMLKKEFKFRNYLEKKIMLLRFAKFFTIL